MSLGLWVLRAKPSRAGGDYGVSEPHCTVQSLMRGDQEVTAMPRLTARAKARIKGPANIVRPQR